MIFNPKSPDLQDIKSFYQESASRIDDEVDLGEDGTRDGRRRVFLVAEHRGRIVGTAALREAPGMPDLARTCKLWRIFVHPATRRMGIATKLIGEAVREARRMGYER